MENESDKKSYSIIQWFFYVILIPLLFAIILSLLLLTFTGLNVFNLAKEYGSNIPIVSSIFPGEQDEADSLQPDPFALEAEIENQREVITDLESEISSKEEEISALQIEVDQLMRQLNEKQVTSEQVDEELTKLVSLYETMSPKDASAILLNMDQEDTIDIVRLMSNETVAAILSKMPPENAAELTVALKGS